MLTEPKLFARILEALAGDAVVMTETADVVVLPVALMVMQGGWVHEAQSKVVVGCHIGHKTVRRQRYRHCISSKKA